MVVKVTQRFPPPLIVVVSLQMSVEVERKFSCDADTLITLEKIGGVCYNPSTSSLHH